MGTPPHVGRHAALRSKTPSSKPVARTVLATTGIFAAAIAAALGATGGTYALWNDTAVPAGSAIATGNTGLTVENVTDFTIPGLSTAQLYPGTSVFTTTPLALKNTGYTPLQVTPATAIYTSSTNGMSGYLSVALKPATSCSASAVGVTPVSVGIPRINPGQTIQVCVEVRLSASAPASVQGGSATFALVLDALQVR
jgi:predicted ribosomally synthesized peptide with SipW-like signal peptide